MKQIIDRGEKILEYIQPYMQECFYESCQLIQKELEQGGAEIWDELRHKILNLLLQVNHMQEQQKKGDIQYLVYSLLKSSIYSNRLELYLDALDSGFYLDMQETAVSHELIFLKSYLMKDLECLNKIIGKKFIRLQSHELLKARMLYADYYSSLIGKMLESQIHLIIGTVMESGIGITDSFQILYGEYMGEAAILYIKEN